MTDHALAITAGFRALAAAPADAEALARVVGRNLAPLGAWLPAVAALADSAAAAAHLQSAVARAESGDVLEWHLFLDEQLCGAIRLKEIDHTHRKAKLGYWLDAAQQGRGLAGMAVRAVLQHAFGTLGLNRIELECAAGNQPSQRLAVRLGFQLEGRLRQAEWLHGQVVDLLVYGLLREDVASGAVPLQTAPRSAIGGSAE